MLFCGIGYCRPDLRSLIRRSELAPVLLRQKILDEIVAWSIRFTAF